MLPSRTDLTRKTGGPLYYDNVKIDPSTEIRLLHLLPGEDGDTISCHLTSATVHLAEFDALSYTWGERSDGHAINLNGISGFSVTDNLFAALRRLRRTTTTRTLWVDAVCIDQADLDERAQQVKTMCAIYQGATRVLIWLGDADEPAMTKLSPFRTSKHTFTQQQRPQPRTSVEEDHVMRSLDYALATTRPQWWTRVWIVQEAVLAEDPVFCFGNFELPWDALGKMRERMSEMIALCFSAVGEDEYADSLMDECPATGTMGYYVKRHAFLQSMVVEALRALDSLRSVRHAGSGLSDIASSTAKNEATDKKDRVFGYSAFGRVNDLVLLSQTTQDLLLKFMRTLRSLT